MPQLLAYAHPKLPQMRIDLFTNGALLAVDKDQELVDADVRRFMISEHGSDIPQIVEPIVDYR